MAGSSGQQNASERSPILVTGAHRSGSTWVGRMLAYAGGVGYISEPFNVERSRRGVFSVDLENFFYYVTEDNEHIVRESLARTLGFRYDVRAELPHVRSARDALRMVRDIGRCAWARTLGRRPLMKDPIAIFSAPWLARRFEMDVVVLVRHPAAFANSLKRLGWHFDFRQFLDQPRLMDELLAPLRQEIEEYAVRPPDIIGQAILLWRAIYSTVDSYRHEHPDWHFPRHEDLSRDPATGFRKLYEGLGLDFSPRAAARVLSHSKGTQAEVAPGIIHQLKRDSSAVVHSWKRLLSPEEIERIKAGTADVWPLFYNDGEW